MDDIASTESAFEIVRHALVEEFAIDQSAIIREANIFVDLSIDSLDVLDLVCLLERKLSIKIPVDEWIFAVNQGEADVSEYFTVGALCDRLEQIRSTQSGEMY